MHEYDNMSIEELEATAIELEGAINNEMIWLLGASAEEVPMFEGNIAHLKSELEYVKGLIENEDLG